MISMIAAMSLNRVIGKNKTLPWHMPIDLKYFNRITKDHYIIMGRKTFESIGSKPLYNRPTIVVSSNKNFQAENCFTATSLKEAIKLAQHHTQDEIFITGGTQLYIEGLTVANKIYLSTIDTYVEDGDAFFPKFDLNLWSKVSSTYHAADTKNLYNCRFEIYEKII